ncbi:Multiple antibiotic resistance protein marA [uncultured Eubacterium sp.]|nr:Multiple antibiotic resistance protein marA [uncultured Eubacterium sp.]
MSNLYNGRSVEREESKAEFNISHLLDTDGFNIEFHSHNFVEIYLSISGGKHFIINDKIYTIKPGDIFVSNVNEIHRVIANDKDVYERYIFEFKPIFVLPYCTAETDLLHYVYNRDKNFSHQVSLNESQFREILSLIEKYESLEAQRYGSDILKKVCYIEILTFISEVYLTAPVPLRTQHSSNHSIRIVADTLEYISSNLTADLSLDNIAKHIGLGKYHLCKLFKDKTGTTINKYIVSCRIAKAKSLLSSGSSVTNACQESGFHDISHFVRTFHNAVGLSPGKYAQDNKNAKVYYEEYIK